MVKLRLIKRRPVPSLTIERLTELVKKFALPVPLVASIIEIESSWNRYAMRYEPSFSHTMQLKENSKRLGITFPSEQIGQKTSWGLMQVMGATARLMGFKGHFPELCDVDLGIEWGCRYLRWQSNRYKTQDEWIAAYNAGTARRMADERFANQEYVDKVNTLIKVFSF